jgi:hypothetical protein
VYADRLVHCSTVVVAINDDVNEDMSLLTTIKEEFTAASRYLYTATNNRAYFKDITILVPVIWNDFDYATAVTETWDDAEIQISSTGQDRAYARRDCICGTSDGYMRMTVKRLRGQVSIQSFR